MMNQYVRCSGCGVVSKFNPDKVSCKLCAINVSTTDIFKPDLKEYNFDQSKLSILNYLNLHSRGYDFKNDLLAVCSLPVYFMGKLANRQILKLVLTSSDLSFQITDLAKELAGKDGELNSAHMLLKSLGFSLVYERKVISYRPYRFQKVFVNVKEKLAALLSIEKESGVISFMIEAPRLDGTICHASNDPNDFYLESNSSFCLPSASPDELVKLVRNNVKLTERRKVEFSLKKYSTATAAQFRNDVDAAIKDSSLVIENPSTGTVDIVEESTNNINVTSPSAPVATVAPPISKKVAPGIKCELHKDVNAETSCVICNKPLCSLCIREVKGIIYCDLHYSNTEDKDSNAKTAAVATESSELEVGRVGRSLNLENAGTIGPFGLFAVETVTFMLLMNLLLPIDLLPTFRFIPFETVTGISIGKATIYIYGLLLYNLLTVTLLAGTPLMHILRFKVISQDGSNASYINLIIRELYFIASAILLLPFIGYLFALFNYEKRSAGDIIAGTKVVTTDSKIKDYIGAGMIVLLLISALFFSKEFFKLGNIQDRSLNFSLSHNLPDKIIYKSQWTDYFPDATVDSDKFVISLKKNRLIAHNLTTGQNLWENNVKNSQELLISNDSQNLYVLLTGEETVLIIFNPQTGELLKSVRIDATSVKLIRLAD
ncbi:MAG: RDD family protein, partial [Nitrospinota bacterium]